MKRLVNIFFFFLVLQPVEAQELNAKVNVVYAKICRPLFRILSTNENGPAIILSPMKKLNAVFC
jgi:hypothetical protein